MIGAAKGVFTGVKAAVQSGKVMSGAKAGSVAARAKSAEYARKVVEKAKSTRAAVRNTDFFTLQGQLKRRRARYDQSKFWGFIGDVDTVGLGTFPVAIGLDSYNESKQEISPREMLAGMEAYEARFKRAQEGLERNVETLRQNFPHQTRELLAGRRLPEGAIRIGGAPREDLLQEVALAMMEAGDAQGVHL